MSKLGTSVADMTIEAFTAELASASPTPGGGSAAAVAAALAASLTAMVVRVSIGRTSLGPHADLHAEALTAADAARVHFLELAAQDSAAYSAYRDARRLPHDTQEEALARAEATRQAARGAAAIPFAVVDGCKHQAELAERLAGRTLPAVSSDLEVAAFLLGSAAHGAAANVRVNLPSVEDDAYATQMIGELDERLQVIEAAAARMRSHLADDGRREAERA
jgi:formiminotetrahydrofolate cyclodeaminase